MEKLKKDKLRQHIKEKRLREGLMDIDGLIQYLPDQPAKKTVYSWTNKKLIPYYKYGKKLFFKKTEIDEWNTFTV